MRNAGISFMKTLSNHLPCDEFEFAHLRLLKSFIMKYNTDPFSRHPDQDGSITASAVVVNETFSKILLMHHKIHNFYKQCGGHADGNPDLGQVALNELKEEAGLFGNLLSPNPIDVVVWRFPAHQRNGKLIPEHNIYDVGYLIQASENAPLNLSKREGVDLKWMPLGDWHDMVFDDNNPVVRNNPHNPIYNQRICKKINAFHMHRNGHRRSFRQLYADRG